MSQEHSTELARKFKHFIAFQRGEIDVLLKEGVPKTQIVRKLGISRSTLSRELERGTNENRNALIRRFIPKGKPIGAVAQEVIERVKQWINSLPRKLFGYRTLDEMFEEEINA